MVEHQQQVADDRRAGPERRRRHVVGRRRAAATRRQHRAASSSRLKPRDERKLTRRAGDRSELRPKLAADPGHRASTCRIRRRSASAARSAKSLYQFTLQDAGHRRAVPLRRRCSRAKLRADRRRSRTSPATCRSRARRSTSTSTATRRRRSGVTAEQIENALYNAYGSRQVSTIYAPTNQYQVILELRRSTSSDPTALVACSTCARSGGQLVAARRGRDGCDRRRARSRVNHSGQLPVGDASRSTCSRASSLGDAVDAIEQARRERRCRRPSRTSFQGDGAGVPGSRCRAWACCWSWRSS